MSHSSHSSHGDVPNVVDVEPALDWNELIEVLDIQRLPHQIEECDVVQKRLGSVSNWSHFYNSYAKWTGFSVRMQHVRKDKNKVEWQRLWVCSREGFRQQKWMELPSRKKKPRQITRIGCLARLQITLDRESGLWIATVFNHAHNHELASPSEIQFLRSHRVVPPCVLQQAQAMRRAGIRTMSILDYVSQQYGGRQHLPFLKVDLYNNLSAIHRRVGAETDCEGALGYLTCLAIRDEHFFCRFNVDEENRLHTIFWADGTSRRDFSIFGDVLAFDTTYRTNAYNKPLMLFVGVNHHYRTTVFAVALLADETTSTFCWVLQQFLECMDNKIPLVVLTDGDHAMRSAIVQQFPSTIHRLCSWHLETNAGTNVPNGEFKLQFSKLMYKYYTPSEFEEYWSNLVDRFNLEDDEWAASLYDKRKSWAETFLRGNFFGGMRSTQRCESMNSYMRRFLHSKHLLRDFVSGIDQGIHALRHTEMQDDFTTKHTEPLLPLNDPLIPYYKQMSSVFTRAIYNFIAKQIQAHNSFSITSVDYSPNQSEFTLSKFRCGEIRHRVQYHPSNGHLNCACLLFETDGIPCRHIFAVMKHLNIAEVPLSLMRACWRKEVKCHTPFAAQPSHVGTPDILESSRMATLASEFHTLGFYASKFDDSFLEARHEVRRMTDKFKQLLSDRHPDQDSAQVSFDEDLATRNNVLKDPVVAKTKGRERDNSKYKNNDYTTTSEARRNKCSICHEMGHNKQTCHHRRPTNLNIEFPSQSTQRSSAN